MTARRSSHSPTVPPVLSPGLAGAPSFGAVARYRFPDGLLLA